MKRWLVICSVAMVAVLVAAAMAASTRAGNKTAKVTGSVTLIQAGGVDFGSVDVDYFADLMKKRGLKVNFQTVGDVTAALRALISGQADILVNAIPDGILADANGGAKLKLIAANNQASDYVLLGLPGHTINNIKGDTLAIDTPGSAGEVSALIALQKSGVDPNSVHPVVIGSSGARTTAILAGRVDLAPVHVGLALSALATGKVIQTLDIGKVLGPYLQSGMWANPNFLKKKALAQEVVNDFINTERWADSNKFGYIKYANAHGADNGLTADQESKVWDYYRNVGFFGINGGLCQTYLKSSIALDVAAKAVPNPAPSQKLWLDDSFVKAYLKLHHRKPSTC
jgi:ABC-type nitrate/sulfonate/bicarbonate transport system substrate-binding protein